MSDTIIREALAQRFYNFGKQLLSDFDVDPTLLDYDPEAWEACLEEASSIMSGPEILAIRVRERKLNKE